MDTEYKHNCEKCNYHCNETSKWNKHIATIKHITGIKKVRSDMKEPYSCNKCDYKTKNKTIFIQHTLNYHSSIEERENKFSYYCKHCDYGTMSKKDNDKHNLSIKHKRHTDKI